jgi:hypothetical protein
MTEYRKQLLKHLVIRDFFRDHAISSPSDLVPATLAKAAMGTATATVRAVLNEASHQTKPQYILRLLSLLGHCCEA